MKKAIQAFLQRALGFERYLFWFSRFKIATFALEPSKHDGDFTHLLSLIKPSDNILDIGANIGIMAVPLAKACPQGRVIAFEPVPDNFQALQRVVQHYKLSNVVLKQLALGEEPGSLTMKMPVINGVRMQGLSYVDDQTIAGYGEVATEDYHVPVHTLDSLDILQAMKIDAIKIDVENYEQFVLRGGKGLIERNQPIIYCELWPNENRTHVFHLLRSLDYQVKVLEGDVLIDYIDNLHTQQNFFFLPRSRTFQA
ncbi:MAG: FkbM family methyltransferase [Bacteroidia bacterium]|nr:FkbM family methyltransferase [Bacteroidia bacterium]